MSTTTSPQPAWLYVLLARLLPPGAGLRGPGRLRVLIEAALAEAYACGLAAGREAKGGGDGEGR